MCLWAELRFFVGSGSFGGDLAWGAANPAADKSYYRLPSILAGNPAYTASEWVQKTMAEVQAAVETDSARIGYHIYNP